jgi:hypothetical protein
LKKVEVIVPFCSTAVVLQKIQRKANQSSVSSRDLYFAHSLIEEEQAILLHYTFHLCSSKKKLTYQDGGHDVFSEEE